MEACTRLAAHLDISMLLGAGIDIHNEGVRDDDMPFVLDLAGDLGGRFLIKYVREDDLDRYSSLSGIKFFPGRHFVTPTTIAVADLEAALNLPHLSMPRGALLLRPEELTSVRGPRRVAAGVGVEYILDAGFSLESIVQPQWAVRYG